MNEVSVRPAGRRDLTVEEVLRGLRRADSRWEVTSLRLNKESLDNLPRGGAERTAVVMNLLKGVVALTPNNLTEYRENGLSYFALENGRWILGPVHNPREVRYQIHQSIYNSLGYINAIINTRSDIIDEFIRKEGITRLREVGNSTKKIKMVSWTEPGSVLEVMKRVHDAEAVGAAVLFVENNHILATGEDLSAAAEKVKALESLALMWAVRAG